MADPLQSLPPQVSAALERGNVIQAIKLLREHRPQMGLAEAKALIDALQKQANVKVIVKPNVSTSVHHASKPHSPAAHAAAHSAPHAPPRPSMDPYASPGEVPRGSHMAAFVAILIGVVIVIAAAAYFGK